MTGIRSRPRLPENGLGVTIRSKKTAASRTTACISYNSQKHIDQMGEAFEDGVDLDGLHPLGLHRPGQRLPEKWPSATDSSSGRDKYDDGTEIFPAERKVPGLVE